MSAVDAKPTRQTFLTSFLQRYGIYLALVLLVLFTGSVAPAFWSQGNLVTLTRSAAILALVTIGQAFVVIGGGIDLSVGGVMSMTTIIAADVTQGSNDKVLVAVFVALGLCALVGLINGLLVTQRNIPPFVVTLGMLILLDGARLAYTKGIPSGNIPDLLQTLGKGNIWVIPIPVLIVAATGLIAWFVLSFGRYGRSLYATGSNPVATLLSGIQVDRVRIISYVVSSLVAGLAGILYSGYIGYVDRYIGRGFDLDSIAAVAVGGISLAGGVGSLVGGFAGVLLITVLANMVVLLNLNVEFQLVVKGLVILAAVALYSARNSRS